MMHSTFGVICAVCTFSEAVTASDSLDNLCLKNPAIFHISHTLDMLFPLGNFVATEVAKFRWHFPHSK